MFIYTPLVTIPFAITGYLALWYLIKDIIRDWQKYANTHTRVKRIVIYAISGILFAIMTVSALWSIFMEGPYEFIPSGMLVVSGIIVVTAFLASLLFVWTEVARPIIKYKRHPSWSNLMCAGAIVCLILSFLFLIVSIPFYFHWDAALDVIMPAVPRAEFEAGYIEWLSAQ